MVLSRQESFFHYLFGVEEEDFLGALNIGNGESTLFMPQLPPSYAVWLGPIQARRFDPLQYPWDPAKAHPVVFGLLTSITIIIDI